MAGPHDDRIAAIYRSGERDVKVIADEVGLDPRSIYRALERTGDRQPIERKAPELTPAMIAMLEDEASYCEVAETFHVSVGWLRKTAPGYGWSPEVSGAFARALKREDLRVLHHEIERIAL